MLRLVDEGLYCEAGGFHVDPSRPVDRALITHAHSDHARPGSGSYLCAAPGKDVLQLRLGPKAAIHALPYGMPRRIGEVTVSFHPAGHVLGSSQIRIEHRGEVWVVSGDYKRQDDPTCTPFEPVRCHTFITEATFGLPIYRWPNPETVFREINAWWRANQNSGRISLMHAYSLGKAQRLLSGLDPAIGAIHVHPAVANHLPAYAAAGVHLPTVHPLPRDGTPPTSRPSLVLAPPGPATDASLSGWGDIDAAFASGWMQVRRFRRTRGNGGGSGGGFVLSDHCDWPDLIRSIRETGAERILVTHGESGPLVRWLREKGWSADPLEGAAQPTADGSLAEIAEESP